MTSKWIATGASVLALAVMSAAAPQQVFDKPVSTKVVPLPPDKLNARAKPKRTCSYFPGFVVKETDLGEKGAAELSITPVKNGAPPACTEKIAGEIVLKDWSGYFLGAKGPYIFFDADDGWEGGMGFGVFDAASGKKLFEESRDGQPGKDFDAIALTPDGLDLRFRRVVLAKCSLYKDGAGCWKKIMADTGLSESVRPDCSTAYLRWIKQSPTLKNEIPGYNSVVAYNVEARYAGGKLAIKPLGGAVKCWVED